MGNKKMYSEAVRMALKVGFLDSKEEFNMYVRAVYSAMAWGMKESKKELLEAYNNSQKGTVAN